jgi:hypothetical protein
VFIASEPVFSLPAARKGWLLVVVGVLGHQLNEVSRLPTDALFVTDMDQLKNHQAYFISALTAKRLQAKVKQGAMSLDAMYAVLDANLASHTIPSTRP